MFNKTSCYDLHYNIEKYLAQWLRALSWQLIKAVSNQT